MQYADTASVYACPVCGSRYWEDCIAGCTLYMEREYTDGTVIYNIPRMPWLTQCPRCGSLFDRKFLVFQENFPGAYPHLYRGWEEAEQKPASLTPDASLWEAAYKKGLYFPPSVGEAERKEYGEKVLVSLWRAYHWPKDGKVQISRRGYEEFTRHLLRTLPPDKEENVLILAEANRHLGNFGECMRLLRTVTCTKNNFLRIAAIAEGARSGNTRTQEVSGDKFDLFRKRYLLPDARQREELLRANSFVAVYVPQSFPEHLAPVEYTEAVRRFLAGRKEGEGLAGTDEKEYAAAAGRGFTAVLRGAWESPGAWPDERKEYLVKMLFCCSAIPPEMSGPVYGLNVYACISGNRLRDVWALSFGPAIEERAKFLPDEVFRVSEEGPLTILDDIMTGLYPLTDVRNELCGIDFSGWDDGSGFARIPSDRLYACLPEENKQKEED